MGVAPRHRPAHSTTRPRSGQVPRAAATRVPGRAPARHGSNAGQMKAMMSAPEVQLAALWAAFAVGAAAAMLTSPARPTGLDVVDQLWVGAFTEIGRASCRGG